MFSTWLDGVVSLTRDQRRKTFMMLGLREADLVASEADDEFVPAAAPAVIAARLAHASERDGVLS